METSIKGPKYSAKELREMVKQLSTRYLSIERQDMDQNIQFLNYLNEAYSWNRMCVDLLSLYGSKYFIGDPIMSNMTDKGLSEESILSAMRSDLFESAVGLVTFGYLPAIREVVANLPYVRLRGLARCLYLLPLPDDLNAVDKPNDFLIWFNYNFNHIKWNSEKEIYVFDN